MMNVNKLGNLIGKNIGNFNYKKSQSLNKTFSPIKLYKFYNLYSSERHETFRFINPIIYSLDSIFNNCRYRYIGDESGNLLAGYVYKFRKNLRDEKSLFIDALARNKNLKSDKLTRNLMIQIYDDIKKLAIKNDAKEITLYVFARDTKLRKNYESLGFILDEKSEIPRAYVMRARVDKFLNNAYYKFRKYKALLNISSIFDDPALKSKLNNKI